MFIYLFIFFFASISLQYIFRFSFSSSSSSLTFCCAAQRSDGVGQTFILYFVLFCFPFYSTNFDERVITKRSARVGSQSPSCFKQPSLCSFKPLASFPVYKIRKGERERERDSSRKIRSVVKQMLSSSCDLRLAYVCRVVHSAAHEFVIYFNQISISAAAFQHTQDAAQNFK